MLVIQPICASRWSMFFSAFTARRAAFACASSRRLGEDRRDQEQHLATVRIASESRPSWRAHRRGTASSCRCPSHARRSCRRTWRRSAVRDPIRRPARSPAGPAGTARSSTARGCCNSGPRSRSCGPSPDRSAHRSRGPRRSRPAATNPQSCVADLNVFVGHVVALVVRRQSLHAEILGRQIGTAGHHVPAPAPARNLVQRADDARRQVWRIGEGRQRRHDPQPRGRRRHQRRHHRRFLPRDRHAVLQIDVARVLPGLADIDRIFQQQVVECRPARSRAQGRGTCRTTSSRR